MCFFFCQLKKKCIKIDGEDGICTQLQSFSAFIFEFSKTSKLLLPNVLKDLDMIKKTKGITMHACSFDRGENFLKGYPLYCK